MIDAVVPEAVVALISSYLCTKDLFSFESTKKSIREIIKEFDGWKELVQQTFEGTKVLNDTADSYRHLLLCYDSKNPTYYKKERQLASKVFHSSSGDRDDESPDHTVEDSLCFIRYEANKELLASAVHVDMTEANREMLGIQIGLHAQDQCGCGRGRSCYWSSAPNTDRFSNEFIEYSFPTLAPCSIIIESFSIIPYRAFWHPESPVYGPDEVSLSIGCLNSQRVFESDYTSPRFKMKNEMSFQTFRLTKPAYGDIGSIVRVDFYGKPQHQTIGADPMLPVEAQELLFYNCISLVQVPGALIYKMNEN